MKVVITGSPQSGQQQLFSLLTGIPMDTIQQKPTEVHLGVCEVRDPRVTKLIEMYKPKKSAYARIEYALLPDGSLQNPALKNAEEISGLDPADRLAFMKEMGIEESALEKMSRLAFAGLGLISFFTVGEDEVRAWPVPKGSTAPEAGRTIHSDIEKGFVRAEMFKYSELLAAGSEAKLKEQGKFLLKGRDYVVEDADILNFRFNV